MKKNRKPRSYDILKSRYAAFRMHKGAYSLKAGKRQFKTPSTWGAIKIAKARGRDEIVPELETLHKQWKKWSSMKLKDYSKSWKTRIKNERMRIKELAAQYYEEFSTLEDIEADLVPRPDINTYQDFDGIDCRTTYAGSVNDNKLPSYVDYYFNGSYEDFYKNFDYFKALSEWK